MHRLRPCDRSGPPPFGTVGRFRPPIKPKALPAIGPALSNREKGAAEIWSGRLDFQSKSRKHLILLIFPYASTISLFADWWGALPIRRLRHSDAARFVEEVLKRLPPSYGRTKANRRRPLQEILAPCEGGGTGLSAATINRHVGTLKTIWAWAKKLGYCDGDNPPPPALGPQMALAPRVPEGPNRNRSPVRRNGGRIGMISASTATGCASTGGDGDGKDRRNRVD